MLLSRETVHGTPEHFPPKRLLTAFCLSCGPAAAECGLTGTTGIWGSLQCHRDRHHPSSRPSLPAAGGNGTSWDKHIPLPQEPHALFSESKQICYFAKSMVWFGTFHSAPNKLFTISPPPACALPGKCQEMPRQWGRGKNLHVNVLGGHFLTSP